MGAPEPRAKAGSHVGRSRPLPLSPSLARWLPGAQMDSTRRGSRTLCPSVMIAGIMIHGPNWLARAAPFRFLSLSLSASRSLVRPAESALVSIGG